VNERGVAEFRALRDRINAASSPEDAAGGQVAAARLLSERQPRSMCWTRKRSLTIWSNKPRSPRRVPAAVPRPGARFLRRGDQRAALAAQIPLLVSLVKYSNARGAAIAAANAAQRTATDQTFAETAELEKTSSIAKA